MPFLLKIEWNGRHQLELRSLPWKFCSSIWARMELEFMSNPFTKSDVLPARLTIFCSIPTYILCRIHIVRTQRTISEITFQMWDISIPDVGYIHTWCSRRSTAGSSNWQYWHASILCGHCMLVWRSHSSRSIVHLHSEQFIYIHNKISIVDA